MPYVISLCAVKVSILLLYRSLFPTHKFHIVIGLVGILIVVWSFMSLCVAIFACWPISGNWDPKITTCINEGLFFLVAALINIITDLAVLCLPLRQVWQLQLSSARKIAVSGLFLLGGLYVASIEFCRWRSIEGLLNILVSVLRVSYASPTSSK